MPHSRAEKPSERPTMRQIAALVGVSAMTVSRALRDNPRISPEMRAQVKKIARQLGYRPDPEVAKLMTHLRRRGKPRFIATIAGVTSLPADIEPPFLRRARESAQARAAELGYGFEVFRVPGPEKLNRTLERTLVNRGIDGVLLLQMHAPVQVERLLDWGKFSAVIATPSVLAPEFPRVLAHYYHNASLLCEQLARHGRRRIAFVGPESFGIRTRHAFAAAAAWRTLSVGEPVVAPFSYADWLPDEAEFRAWFRRERPDAIITHTEAAAAVLAGQLGLAPRGPVVFACTNVDPLAPTLPGIDERHDLIGRKAVDVLTSLLNRNEKNLRASHTGTLIDGRWIEPAAP